ncbi:MAG: hypothetical protein ACK5KT_08630 [Dysgonomonas sp.]
MERLKSILADKILDLTSDDDDDVKKRIDKIQLFRDFAYACKVFMDKYPAIEDELIKMVNDDNFDTKEASLRVDVVIRSVDSGLLEDLQKDYIQYHENIQDEKIPAQSTVSEFAEDNMYPSEEELASVKRKTTIRRIFQVVGLALAVIVLIFIINFVREYWQIILIITGLLTVLAILLIWFVRKRN